MGPVCEALRAQGLATWNVEYRRLGEPGGGWPGTFLDVAAATDHLRDIAPAHGLDLGRVITLGHSAGGHLSLWVAARRWIRDGELFQPNPLRVQGAVSLAGVVDLRRAWSYGLDAVTQLMGGTPDDVPERYDTGSPADLLPLGVPQILVHGRDDRVVPADLSVEYHAVAIRRGDDVRLVPLTAVGHYELIEPASPAWPPVAEAVATLA
jgi:acetyl esterase/lipase